MSATNSLGWGIQRYSETVGWVICSEVLPTKEAAEAKLADKCAACESKHRVYEALK